jgi:hypothetical protein
VTVGCTEADGVDTSLVEVLETLGALGTLGALETLETLGTLGVTILIEVGTASGVLEEDSTGLLYVGGVTGVELGVLVTFELMHFPFERTCPNEQVRHPIPPSLYVKA